MEWSIWRVERRESKTKMNKRKQEISYARMPQFLRIPSIKSERKNKRMHKRTTKNYFSFSSRLFFFCFSLYVLVFALCIFKYKYYLDCNSHLFNRRTIKTKHRNRFGERSEFEASKASDIQKKIANERKRNCERKKDEEKLNEWERETKRNRKKHQPFFRMAFFGMCTQYTLDRSATSHGFSARKLFWRFFRRLPSDLLHFFRFWLCKWNLSVVVATFLSKFNVKKYIKKSSSVAERLDGSYQVEKNQSSSFVADLEEDIAENRKWRFVRHWWPTSIRYRGDENFAVVAINEYSKSATLQLHKTRFLMPGLYLLVVIYRIVGYF